MHVLGCLGNVVSVEFYNISMEVATRDYGHASVLWSGFGKKFITVLPAYRVNFQNFAFFGS